MVVVDASVLAPALGDDGHDGSVARLRLAQETLTAPDLIDLETTSVLRRFVRNGSITAARATAAMHDLTDLPLRRVQHRELLARCWELRGNLTPYDASYVALAEILDATLITADVRLARSSGIRCSVEVLHA